MAGRRHWPALAAPRPADARGRPARPRSASAGTVTLTVLVNRDRPAWMSVLIPNFERAYPNIKVDVTYAPTSAGAATSSRRPSSRRATLPTSSSTCPGCGTPISICKLAKAGYLAPMVEQAVGEALACRS